MTETIESSTVAERLLGGLTPETRVTLYPLTMRLEDEEYIVGRAETGEFVALPEVGGRIVELFRRGCPLGEAQAQLQQEYGAEVDLDDFVASLVELGFVQALDGHRLETAEAPRPNLAWLQARHVRWLFSRPVQFIYLILLAAAAFTLVTRPELFPRYQDFFWSPITSLVILVNTAIVMTNLALHELAHLVAARSLGVPARIGLGTRLHNLVVQTDVTGLWAVPRRQRYRVYLAGMAWNLFGMSVAFLLLAYAPLAALARDLLQALVLAVFLGVLWQFEFYMRTDMYFVIMDLLRCHNLFGDSLAYLRYRARRLWRRVFPTADAAPANPLDHLPTHERRKVSLYAWFVLVGSTVSLIVFALYGLPILVELFVKAGLSVWQGVAQRQLWPFLDGAATLAIEGGLQVAFVVTFLRNRRGWLAALRRAAAK
jgi:putative peptide zinc metalloprotease protein